MYISGLKRYRTTRRSAIILTPCVRPRIGLDGDALTRHKCCDSTIIDENTTNLGLLLDVAEAALVREVPRREHVVQPQRGGGAGHVNHEGGHGSLSSRLG